MNKMLFLILNIIVISMVFEANAIPAEVAPNTKTLNDGTVMPSIAFGTFTKMENMDKIQQAILWAAAAGYRHFNTAVFVDDDSQVGQALGNITRNGLVTRAELFITTTLDSGVKSADEVVPTLKRDLERLKLDYVDLYLIEFSPSWFQSNTHENYDIVDIWKGMEKAKELGLAKSIGVSNFNSAQINKILLNSEVRPAVNQIEVSPTYTELDLVAYCQKEGIEVMAYAPLGFLVSRPFMHSAPLTLNDERLKSLATKYKKTPSQIVLRYLIDRGIIPIPESLSLKHIKENIEIFDFQLSPKELYLLNELDTNKKVYPLDESIKDELNFFISGNNPPNVS